jgi:hypothetical protein
MITWTTSQQAALQEYQRFLLDPRPRGILIVRGAAGTGKSTLIREFVQQGERAGQHIALLAPTGRAARVMQERAGSAAGTIHGCIYNLLNVTEQQGETEQPVLRFQLKKGEEPANTVFIVDEASMVGNREMHDENLRFGSGKLLQDLVHYVFHDHPDGRRKLVFVGDPCQLPPVGESASPALDGDTLGELATAKLFQAELTDILRQLEGSQLIQQAHALRAAIADGRFDRLTWNSGADLQRHETSESFFSAYRDSIQHLRFPHLVCYRNATVSDWNRRIRQDAFQRGEQIEPGDLLVVQRNHFKSGLRNGDFVRVLELGKQTSRPFRGAVLVYREAVLGEAGSGRVKHEGLILENQLLSPERNLSSEEEQARWVQFKLDYADLFRKKPDTVMLMENRAPSHDHADERSLPTSVKEAMLTDPYWNALHVRYGYATTCHKAQGGEWDEVFVHCDWGSRGSLHNEEFFRWLYTAVTRSRVRLHVLDVPSFQPWDGLISAVVDTKAAEPKEVQVVSEEKPVEFSGVVKQIVQQLADERGAQLVDWEAKQFMFRVRLEAGEVRSQFDLHYSSKEELRSLSWSAGEPLFQLGELQARLLQQRHSSLDRRDLPAGVIEAIEHLEHGAQQDGLELYWENKPFQLIVKALDPQRCELGVAEACFHYKKDGRSHNLQFKPAEEALKERLRSLFEHLGMLR